MKQAAFEALHAPRWDEFAAWLKANSGSVRSKAWRFKRAAPQDNLFANDEFPRRYREICQHLAIARERQYGAALVDRLNRLALAGYHELHDARLRLPTRIMTFFLADFPRVVRSEWPLVLFASFLLFVPLLAMTWLTAVHPDAALYFMSAEQLTEIRTMYSDSEHIVHRKADSDIAAFGFYIWNNISIDFRAFAGGLVFGLGSVLVLLFNGFYLGAIKGYLISAGLGENLLQFVAGHSGPELIAAALSGAAGLKLGAALIAPGNRSRKLALTESGAIAIRMLYGAATMTLMAAFIEAFWSSHLFVAIPFKLALGGLLWILIVAYLAVCGRPRQWSQSLPPTSAAPAH
jgi:uncharacterized membrane protein SpoIIM required for sporulation